jgi:hypothetical protein
MAGVIQHTYRYAFPSALNATALDPQLRLATSGGAAEFPFFFQGALKHPRLTAHLLRVLAKVVAARFHVPPAMLERILRECDPVVTSGGGLLRFEGFSACGSVYARVDLNPDAYTGVVVGQGTTNVDFNAPFRAALAQIRDNESVGLAVGTDDVTLLRGADQWVERKVTLPLRWLKGFVEVQSYQSRMEFRAKLGKIETLRFLRSLPRTTMAKTAFWIVPAGAGLRVSQRESADGIRVGGIERLRVLEELAPHADGLSVYANPQGTASEWQLVFGPLRFSLTLSPDVWRGFSGEGQVLSDLGTKARDVALERVHSALQWQAEVRAEDFVSEVHPTLDAIRRALSTLGSRGLVGYDLARSAYFHRELPFDLSLVEELHPRLAGARELVAKGGVTLLQQTDDLVEAEVVGSHVVHRVRLSSGGNRCTCTWHAKHQGERGPCKHILAVQLHVENEPTSAHAIDTG